VAFDEVGVAKREIGKLNSKSPGAIVPSGLFQCPCRFVFQKEKLGEFLYPAGEPKKVGGGGSGKILAVGKFAAR
jgi:hypothetical protein